MFSQAIHEAIAAANRRGILFVAAAGNSSGNNDHMPMYPAGYDIPNVISVAATNALDELADFSCYGKRSVDIAAPGVDIMSTIAGGDYAVKKGTSMATPHVSGALALIKARFPGASVYQLKTRLLSSVDRLPQLRDVVASGGRLNVARALEADDIAPSTPSALSVVSRTATSLSLQWRYAGDDNDLGYASDYEVRLLQRPIATESDWLEARRMGMEVDMADLQIVKAQIPNLSLNDQGFLAIRAVDNVGNIGPMSESIPYHVQSVILLSHYDGSHMGGIVVQGPWGVEQFDDEYVISDSPYSEYENSIDISLELPPMQSQSNQVLLWIKHTYELEPRYDFGYIEVSTDGGLIWNEVQKFNGVLSGWVSETVDLSSYLHEATAFQVRLRMTTDSTVPKNGWLIDSISISENR
jgi:hypothetical protein